MLRPSTLFLTVTIVAGLSSAARAQSLADVAKKTAEQRKDQDASRAPKVYSNKDLKDAPGVTVAGTTTPPPPIAVEDEAARQADYKVIAKKDEAYWKARMQALQEAIETDELQLAAMAARVRTLTADLNNSLTVSERTVLRREREEAATEATRLRAVVLADRRNITRAEEEARRANVPPGWLRP